MDLRCTICSKDFDEFDRLPRVIPQCGHSYCDRCIKRSLQERKNIFICPVDNQTHIFRRENEQLPKNIVIIKAIKDLKVQTIAKNRQNIVLKKYEEDIKNSSLLCEQHQKPIQFMCLQDRQSICSHCALFGAHKGHQIQNLSKVKSSKNIDNLFQKALNCMDSLCDQALPILESPNIFIKSFDNLRRTLRTSVKQTFKQYHQIINRRELYVQKELEELIKTWQGESQSISEKISDSHKNLINLRDHLILLQPSRQESKKDPQVLAIELQDIIKKVSLTQKNIDTINQQLSLKCRQYESQYKQRLENAKYFKIQQMTVDLSGNTPNNEPNRSRSKQDHDLSTHNIKVRGPSNSIYESRQQHPRKQNLLPPKHTAATNLIRLGSTAKSRMFTANGSESGNSLSKNCKDDHSIDMVSSRKGSPSPIQKDKQQRRVSGKADVRKKIGNILDIINKTQGGNLELIGVEIKDYYLQQIFDYIMKSGKKFGSIKLVKNQITDQGLGIILQSVRNYDYLHTLNLTSNHLTQASLDKIIAFSQQNKILKNFYVRNNVMSMSSQSVKEKKKLMQKMGLNMFL